MWEHRIRALERGRALFSEHEEYVNSKLVELENVYSKWVVCNTCRKVFERRPLEWLGFCSSECAEKAELQYKAGAIAKANPRCVVDKCGKGKK